MKKFAIVYLLIGLGLLIFLTKQILLPFVYDVAKSDAFLVDSKDQASQYAISNDLTNLAFQHCNKYIKSELGEDVTVNFPDKPLKAWTLGNYNYIINSEINITGNNGAATKKYVCRILYENSDDQTGVQDYENWSIEGVDGIDGI